MLTQLTNNTRRYDIDALRVLAFAVLILYHVGMYYVADWGWHIKSEHTSALLQNIMILTSPWRMSLMFFISAVALALVIKKYNSWLLIKLKSKRIMLPLLFGMLFIVAPQPYIEFLSQGLIDSGFWPFWREYINPNTSLLPEKHSPIGLLTWNHLWFLPYLWVYSLCVIVISKPLTLFAQSKLLAKTPVSLFLLTVISLLMVFRFWLGDKYPTSHDLVNDWYNHGKYGLVFVAGFIFALQQNWWQLVIKHRNALLLVAICTYSFAIAERQGMFPELSSAFQSSLWVKLLYRANASVNHWCWLLAAVGYAGFWLNKPSKLVSYANTAVLPWYMLHQSLIIVFAWWLKPVALPPALEGVLLITLTCLGCFIGYEVIKRIPFLATCFGLKTAQANKLQGVQAFS